MKDGGMYGLQQLAERNSEELMREVKLVRGNLTALERATIGALVVIDVHARDIVSEMVQEKVAVEDDFGWLSRLSGGRLWVAQSPQVGGTTLGDSDSGWQWRTTFGRE
eukprot:1161469-Pelagomonas_calceolata.AAC.38